MQLRDALAASPELFPLNMDPAGNAVQFVRLSANDYANASFLDSRMLRPDFPHAVIPWLELQPATAGLTPKCDFIFHISHAGSTLLSRLLGCHPAFFCLREPAILRQLALGSSPEHLRAFLGLWSRTFHSQQRALIKATSFVSEIALELMELVPTSRAMFMYVPLPTFLRALLDGAMSDISGQVELRLKRLQCRDLFCNLTPRDLSPGESVAMSWLAEMLSLSDAKAHFPERTFWLDFDSFLGQPHSHLHEVFLHFGVTTDVELLLSGPIMLRYAKKPEVGYDTAFRNRLLREAERKHAAEIERGLAWLNHANISRLLPPELQFK